MVVAVEKLVHADGNTLVNVVECKWVSVVGLTLNTTVVDGASGEGFILLDGKLDSLISWNPTPETLRQRLGQSPFC